MTTTTTPEPPCDWCMHCNWCRGDDAVARLHAELNTLRAERDTLQRIADERKVEWRRALADAVRLRDAVGPLVEACLRWRGTKPSSDAEAVAQNAAHDAVDAAAEALALDAPADLAHEMVQREEDLQSIGADEDPCPVSPPVLAWWAERGLRGRVSGDGLAAVEMVDVGQVLAWLVARTEKVTR